MIAIIFLWLLCGFCGTYWARNDPKIVGKPMPVFVWCLASFAGPIPIIVNSFYYMDFLRKEL